MLLRLGMAKCTRSAGTRPDPTLMGRVLFSPFNIRVGSGFGSGLGAYPTRTRPVYIILKILKKNPSINTNFPNPKSLKPIHSHSVLPSRLPFSPSPSLSLSQDCCCSLRRCRSPCMPHLAGAALFSTSPAPLHSPPRRLSSLPPSPCSTQPSDAAAPPLPHQALFHLTRPQLSHLPHLAQAFAMKIVLFVERIKFVFSSLSAIFVE